MTLPAAQPTQERNMTIASAVNRSEGATSAVSASSAVSAPPTSVEQQSRKIGPPKFVEKPETMTRGQMAEGVKNPAQEVKIPIPVQRELYEFIQRYDDVTQALTRTGQPLSPFEQAIHQLRLTIDERVKAIKKAQEEAQEKAAKEGKKPKPQPATLSEELIYNFDELILALTALENYMIEQAAYLGSALESDQAPDLYSPTAQNVQKLRTLITQPRVNLLQKAFSLPFQASLSVLASLAGVNRRATGLTISQQPSSSKLSHPTARTEYSLAGKKSDVTEIEILKALQHLRQEVYRAFGLDPRKTDIFDLSLDFYNPLSKQPSAAARLRFQQETLHQLKLICEARGISQSNWNTLTFADKIQLILQAREQAATTNLDDLARQVLAGQFGGEQTKTGEKPTPHLKEAPISALGADMAERRKRAQIPPDLAKKFELETRINTTSQEIKNLETSIDQLHQLEGQGEGSITQAQHKFELAKTKLLGLMGKDSSFDLSQPNNLQEVTKRISEPERDLQIKKQALESKKQLLNQPANQQILIPGQTQEQRQQQLESEIQALQTEIETLQNQLQPIQQAYQEFLATSTELDQLREQKQKLETTLGNTPEERTEKLIGAKKEKQKLEEELASLSQEKMDPEATAYIQKEEWLQAILGRDTNEILYRVTTGQTSGTRGLPGATLDDLAGYQPDGTYDVDKALAAFRHLFCESYPPQAVTLMTAADKAHLFPKLELTYQLALVYGSQKLQELANLRNPIRQAAFELDQLRKQGASKNRIEQAKRNLRAKINDYLSSRSSVVDHVLQEVLPKVRAYGRWRAAEAVSQILISRAQDALDGYLFDPDQYDLKPTATTTTARTTSPTPSLSPTTTGASGTQPNLSQHNNIPSMPPTSSTPPSTSTAPAPSPPAQPDQSATEVQSATEEPASKWLNPDWEQYNPTSRPEAKLEKEVQYGPYTISGGSDRGEVRLEDEDTYAIIRFDNLQETLLIVADGMGGHADGKQASKAAVNVITTEYPALRRQGKSPEDALRKAFEKANKTIVNINKNKKRPTSDYAGTTCVTAVLKDDGSYIFANVGDSRAYVIDVAQAKRITIDHSLVESLVAKGRITADQVYTHSDRNILVKTIGNEDAIELNTWVDIFTGQLQPNQQVLLCCDGLWEMTKDADGNKIHKISRSTANQQEAVRRLLAYANQEGGEDNITVVLAAYRPSHDQTTSPTPP